MTQSIPHRKNRRLRSFREQYDALPEPVKALAVKTFRMFLVNAQHPALSCHELKPTRRGRHIAESYAVYLSMKYRAIYFVSGDTNVWYWIGTHAEYDHFTGKI